MLPSTPIINTAKVFFQKVEQEREEEILILNNEKKEKENKQENEFIFQQLNSLDYKINIEEEESKSFNQNDQNQSINYTLSRRHSPRVNKSAFYNRQSKRRNKINEKTKKEKQNGQNFNFYNLNQSENILFEKEKYQEEQQTVESDNETEDEIQEIHYSIQKQSKKNLFHYSTDSLRENSKSYLKKEGFLVGTPGHEDTIIIRTNTFSRDKVAKFDELVKNFVEQLRDNDFQVMHWSSKVDMRYTMVWKNQDDTFEDYVSK